MPFIFLLTPFFFSFYHLSELLQSGQRQQWRWWWRGRGRRLRDPPHHTSKPRRPLSAPSHRAWVRLPLPLPASQRFAQLLLLPRAARPHDVQYAGSGGSPPLWAYALCKYSFIFFGLSLASGRYASQKHYATAGYQTLQSLEISQQLEGSCLKIFHEKIRISQDCNLVKETEKRLNLLHVHLKIPFSALAPTSAEGREKWDTKGCANFLNPCYQLNTETFAASLLLNSKWFKKEARQFCGTHFHSLRSEKKEEEGTGRWGAVRRWVWTEHLDGDWGVMVVGICVCVCVGRVSLVSYFCFSKGCWGCPFPHSTPAMRLSLMLNTLQTEHVNTPGEHIQML